MNTRREAREWVVQILFQLDLNPSDDIDKAFEEFWQGKTSDEKTRLFAESLVRDVRGNVEQIDKLIAKCAENWDIRRMAVTDRNVLRMAVCELVYRDDIPPVVAINEAVDIAKYFNSAESGRFVNGVLDRARKEVISKSKK